MKLRNNWCLIKPGRGSHEYISSTGQVFYIDVKFEKEKHVPVYGTVYQAPEEFVFTKNDPLGSEWKTTIEIIKGDTVYFHFVAALNAIDEKQKRSVVVDGELLFLIPYTSLFAVKRGNDIIPLNGLVLLEPVTEKQKFTGKEISNTRLGLVRYVGSDILDYAMRDMSEVYQPKVEPGDIAILDKSCHATMEYDFHASLEGKKLFYRVEKRLILGVL